MNLPSKESFIFLHIWKNSLPLPINFSPKSNNILIINFIRNYTHTLYTDVNVHVPSTPRHEPGSNSQH